VTTAFRSSGIELRTRWVLVPHRGRPAHSCEPFRIGDDRAGGIADHLTALDPSTSGRPSPMDVRSRAGARAGSPYRPRESGPAGAIPRVPGTARPSRTFPDQVDTTGSAPEVEEAGAAAPGRGEMVPSRIDLSREGHRVVHTLGVGTTGLRSCSENRHVDLEPVDNRQPWWPRHILSSCPARSRSPAALPRQAVRNGRPTPISEDRQLRGDLVGHPVARRSRARPHEK
jgi:hypothetical protein